MQAIQIHLSHQQKTFSEFSSPSFGFTSNFEHFRKNMTLIAYVFQKLRTPKNVAR